MSFECSWGEPPADITLPKDEVHVWCVFLAQPATRVQSLASTLSKNERIRAERFHFERDRRRFRVSQGYLRTILGRYLKIAPQQIEFRHGHRGKPALKETESTNPEKRRLQFNISHSHELVIYAITRNREVGVDIEHVRPMPDAEQIVERFFSVQERTAFRLIPPSQKIEAFFSCWTRKEAFLKASGEGLYRPLEQFSVSLSPGEPARLLQIENDPQETARWSLRELIPAPGYVAALAVEGHSWELRCWRIH